MTVSSHRVPATPSPVMGLYDEPFWKSVNERRMALQCCANCAKSHYPPVPCCPQCLSTELYWNPVSRYGRILSWTVFHKTYLEAYPHPYNVIAVRLDEGPVFISNLEAAPPDDVWIGQAVELVYVEMTDGMVLPRFKLTANGRVVEHSGSEP